MEPLLYEAQLLTRQGGWIFGGLIALAFAIAFSLLSILSLFRFPTAPPLPGASWPSLLLHRKHRNSPLPPAAASLLASDESAEITARHLFGKLRRRIPFTLTLISTAPLLGLLGTVSGMFATFHGLANSTSRTPVDVISTGVSEALITTQTGLVIGVPSFLVCILLKHRLDRLELEFQRLAAHARQPAPLPPNPEPQTANP